MGIQEWKRLISHSRYQNTSPKMGFLTCLRTWIVPVNRSLSSSHTSVEGSSTDESSYPTFTQVTGMDNTEKRLTTLEAEWLCGYVFGCTLVALGIAPTIAKRSMTHEQEEMLTKFINDGMEHLGQKTSMELAAEEEINRLVEGDS
jgi:hypothetical protein